ncbi:MAG: DUF6364 family protein [Alphaproteobacteria bacterium]
MKNITISVDDETYRKARIVAAERETSVSALVREFLRALERHSEWERLERQEDEIRARIKGFEAGQIAPRESLYDRNQA